MVKYNWKYVLHNVIIFILQTNEDILKVGVYFESLCPDSKAFITTQLYPTMAKLGKYLDISFVPYGNAEVSFCINTVNTLQANKIIY